MVPSDKFEKIARKMASKTTDLKEQSTEYNENEENGGKEVSLSVDENNSDPNLVKLIDLAIKQFTKEGAPVLRANDQEISKYMSNSRLPTTTCAICGIYLYLGRYPTSQRLP